MGNVFGPGEIRAGSAASARVRLEGGRGSRRTGASTKEISKTLYISEYTVQEHLSKVFDKVGVRGRRALIKRLFFDNLYPVLFA